ncbi:MAG: hypothetical protein WCP18_00060 [bacterium]
MLTLRKKIFFSLSLSLIVMGGVLAPIKPNVNVFDGQVGFLKSNVVVADGVNDNKPDSGGVVSNFIGWVLYYVATCFAKLAGLLIQVMVNVAQKNDFLTQPIVLNGWRIVRDICNNFFIIILLAIAIGTIFRVSAYHYKQLLPKLLIMAVLINFSKMIAGIMIDFSQMIMMFFVSPFAGDTGPSIILGSVGLHKLYQLEQAGQASSADIGNLSWQIIFGLFFAIILAVIACVVVACITIILVYRIVMLWFLVILSPAPYLLATFPKGESYASMWWSEITKYLVVGPVMMFFLYLSFFSGYRDASGIDDHTASALVGSTPSAVGTSFGTTNTADTAVKSSMMQPANIFDFMIIIGLMIGSLVAGQKTGVAGASWAGKGIGLIRSTANKGASKAFGGLVYKKDKNGNRSGLAFRAARSTVGAAGAGLAVLSSKAGKASGMVDTGVKGAGVVGAAATAGALGLGAVGAAPLAMAAAVGYGGYRGIKALAQRMTKTGRESRKMRQDLINGSYETEDYVQAKDEAGNLIPDKYEKQKRKFKKHESGIFMEINDKGEFIDKKGELIEYKENSQGEKEWVDKIGSPVDISHLGNAQKHDASGNEIGDLKPSNRVYSAVTKDGKISENWETYMGTYYGSGAGKAAAARDSAEADKISKLANDYGHLNESILQKLLTTEIDQGKKMAIAMTLAIKDGFKGMNLKNGQDKVKEAKAVLGSNDVLIKKFNDEVDKKFAHFNYNLNTASGRATFGKRRDAGKINDVMDSSAYKDPGVLKSLQENMTSEEYITHMKKVKNSSKNHEKSLLTGLDEMIKQDGSIVDTKDKDKMSVSRRAMAMISGDLAKAMQGVDLGNTSQLAESKTAMNDFFSRASNREIANIDNDIFTESEVQKKMGTGTTTPTHAHTFINNVLHVAVNDNMNQNDVENVRRQGGSNILARNLAIHAKP